MLEQMDLHVLRLKSASVPACLCKHCYYRDSTHPANKTVVMSYPVSTDTKQLQHFLDLSLQAVTTDLCQITPGLLSHCINCQGREVSPFGIPTVKEPYNHAAALVCKPSNFSLPLAFYSTLMHQVLL